MDPHNVPVVGLSARAAPTIERERLKAIDATRGLALLGILMVNIQSFAQPFGRFMVPRPESRDAITQFWFYLEKVFCEGKFFPLFSLLFGMGLVLQMRSVERARAAGETRSFRRIYLRRLIVLLIFGLIHALVFWYGDILFMYALAGVVLLLCSRVSGPMLLKAGLAVLCVATGVGGLLGGAMGLAPPPPAAVASTATVTTNAAESPPAEAVTAGEVAAADGATSQQETPAAATASEPDDLDRLAERSPFFKLINGFRKKQIEGGPEQPQWIELESQAYREGPWFDSFMFRVLTWAFYLSFSLFGFGWIVVAMFFIGAALLKLDFFAAHRRPLRKKLLVVGAVVGIPCAAASVWLAGIKGSFVAGAISMMLSFGCAPLMSLMYLSGVSLLVEAGALRRVTSTLASVGRMALTNYLTHTLVCTFIFYHWGLAQFDLWSRGERNLLVLAIFGVQCAISPLWLSRFRFGPMEWVWRSLTYGTAQPMRRTAAGEP